MVNAEAMCGIAGIVGRAQDDGDRAAVLASMLARLAHRGPDGSGVEVDEQVALGCRRLRVVDLVGGDQPLLNEDGSLVLVCNGEIFNYGELRAQLRERGHSLRSESDVEVLLHLYEERGDGLLDGVDGQFAFALYDRRRRRLFAARDRFGVCPLFYTVVDGRLLFASEIKALLADPRVRPRVDVAGLDQVLSLPGLVSPRTLFAGIRSLPPGHALVFADGVVTTSVYWDLDYPRREDIDDSREMDALGEELRALLAAAVRRRLVADVPVGVYLSGGLDSSLLAALAGSRPTFSIGFPGRAHDESMHQEAMARTLSGVHRTISVDDEAVAAGMRSMVWHAECPVKESYNTCASLLAGAAREAGVPVVLCGDGADELFGGYPGYRLDARGARRGPQGLEAALEAELAATVFGEPGVFYERSLLGVRETIKRELYAPAIVAGLRWVDCSRGPLVDAERVRGRHPLHQRSYLDLKLRLADHLLGDHGDRMAMAHGVEPRFPFLDLALVEFVRRLPPRALVDGGVEKAVLRRAAAGLVPEAIVIREKFGFVAEGTPGWISRRVPWVMDMLSPDRVARQGFFNHETVAGLVKKYGGAGFKLALPFEEDLLMIVLSFGLLLETFNLPDYT